VVAIPRDLPLPEIDLDRPRKQPIPEVTALADALGLTAAVAPVSGAGGRRRLAVS